MYLGQRIERLCDLAGLERRSFYALRHTFASMLVQAGESDVSLADAIGHADPSTTKKVYAHMFDAQRRAANGEGTGVDVRAERAEHRR